MPDDNLRSVFEGRGAMATQLNMAEQPLQGPSYSGHASPAGLTLRDYFAAAALTGICGNSSRGASTCDESQESALPAWSYRIADEMLKARSASHGR